VRRALLAIPATAAVILVFVLAARADETPWVIAPGPEAQGAVEAGKADVAKAQKLAKKKQYVEAVQLLEQVDREHPAALHDCNLSLAYLRAGALTRAQLLWDVSALRNADRPDWCTGDLANQLSTALRAGGFVPLTITIVPPDATIEVGGVTIRGVHVVWLPPGKSTIAAHADGYVDYTDDVDVAAPNAQVAIELKKPVTEVPPDAGVVAPPADAGAPPDAAPLALPPPVPPPAHQAEWPGWVGIGVGVLAAGTGVAFHAGAVDARDQGNSLYTFQPAFGDAQDRFARDRDAAIASYVVTAAATAFVTWWWMR
jgi:hypothetical protein